MSDTPRTDAEDVIWQIDYNNHRECDWPPITDVVSSDFARQLERELNAANERIKRLENAGNDLVWWFCQKEESQLSSAQTSALNRWRGLRGRRNP